MYVGRKIVLSVMKWTKISLYIIITAARYVLNNVHTTDLKLTTCCRQPQQNVFGFVSISQRDESLKICCSQSNSRLHVLTGLIKSVVGGGSTCISLNKIDGYYKGMNPSNFVAASQARVSTY
jgi:hypothetical protein